MTKKVWFQVGIGLLLAILIIKYFMEISFLFEPVIIIVRAIIIPLVVGGILFYITLPLQTFLEKYKFPRWSTIVIIFILLGLLLWVFFALIGPPLVKQMNALIENFPTLTKQLNDVTNDLLRQKSNLPENVQNVIDSALVQLQDFALQFGKWTVQFVQSLVQTIALLILVPFFLVFMLKDHEKFAPTIYNLFTGERREWIKKTLRDIDNVLRSYIQGQLLVSLILAIMIWVGYRIIGLQYALLLAIFALFMNLIPFIGPWIAVTPAVIIAYLQDPKLVIGVAIVTVVAQQIESNLITPNIIGKTLDIHPLTVITIILAAGNIAGFVGVIAGVPTYAVIKVIVSNIYAERQRIKKIVTKDV